MKSLRNALVFGGLLAAGAVPAADSPMPNVVLWDTSSPLDQGTRIQNRTGWKAVPSDLLSLEADPPKASSDPGYYGREYSFRGDAVVENRKLAAAIWSSQGKILLYSKSASSPSEADRHSAMSLGTPIAEISPLYSDNQSSRITQVGIVRNGDDQVVLQLTFAGQGSAGVFCDLSFGKNEVVEIKPAPSMKGVSLRSSLQYAVAPAFIGDDLLFNAGQCAAQSRLTIPAENLLLGLLPGETTELVMTWPKGNQSLTLTAGEEKAGTRLFERIDFVSAGHSLFLGALNAPGIWHREPLEASFLEKDVASQWKRPFPARWKTQLEEDGVSTTFAFRHSKGTIWRGVPGSYQYPVWFDGKQAWFHLSKKVAPKGEALIYFLEGQDTPPSVCTPVELLQSTLGRETAEPILDIAGRKLRTHHRRGGQGVRRACTCGCTEAIQAVFQAGEEVSQKSYIQGALEDMIYFVHRHVERINQYRAFADELHKFLESKGQAAPALKPYIESLQQIAQQIPQEYEVQKPNMKSFQYADELARRTLALANQHDTNNVTAYMELLKEWRGMGGAQDYVLARCHMVTRNLCQAAGYGCVEQPEAVALAREVRLRCRQCPRNPDGYEIWADY